MQDSDNSSFHIWRPTLFDIVQLAIGQKCDVAIRSHLPLDECNTADVDLYGRFIKLTGQQAQYLVESFDLFLSNDYLVSPECEYRFAANLQNCEASKSRIEYTGKAVIIDQDLQRNNIPGSLLLRISLPSKIRPLRRHERSSCNDLFFVLPGIITVEDVPYSRKQLLAMLARYYKHTDRVKPKLINISAGGVCIETNDPLGHRIMGTGEHFLFFFFTKNNGDFDLPFIFLGKKVGIFRNDVSNHAGIRIRFLREITWSGSQDEIKWVDIEQNGSPSLKEIIARSQPLIEKTNSDSEETVAEESES